MTFINHATLGAYRALARGCCGIPEAERIRARGPDIDGADAEAIPQGAMEMIQKKDFSV